MVLLQNWGKTKHIQGSCFDQTQAEILLTVYEIHK